jgi:hypothetical protein
MKRCLWFEEINAGQLFGNQWRAIAYCCPKCQTAISVQIDPVALKTDTVNEILRQLGKG